MLSCYQRVVSVNMLVAKDEEISVMPNLSNIWYCHILFLTFCQLSEFEMKSQCGISLLQLIVRLTQHF